MLFYMKSDSVVAIGRDDGQTAWGRPFLGFLFLWGLENDLGHLSPLDDEYSHTHDCLSAQGRS